MRKFTDMTDRFMKHYAEVMKREMTDMMTDFDPFQWIKDKDDFDTAKKTKYTMSTLKFLTGKTHETIGSFRAMVKSGEVYRTTDHLGDEGILEGQESRPRIICVPGSRGCGFQTSTQSVFWKAFRKVYPGFV